MPEVVTLGEALLRLCPGYDVRIEQMRTLDVVIGGAELNVAVGLCCLGVDAAFITKLPKNALGRLIANRAREFGVDVSRIVWTDSGRVGLYFLEYGRKPRGVSVIYDRKDSAINFLDASELDWDFIGKAKVLHTTGITMGLSENCRKLVQDVVRRARELGVTISFDINFRVRLWSAEEARAAFEPLLAQVDILFTTLEDLRTVFGMEGDPNELVRRLRAQWAKKVAVLTIGAEGSLACWDGEEVLHQPSFEIQEVDRVGAGDAFAAGFLFGYLEGDAVKAQKVAAAMAALKYSIQGDWAIVSKEDVERVLQTPTREVQR